MNPDLKWALWVGIPLFIALCVAMWLAGALTWPNEPVFRGPV